MSPLRPPGLPCVYPPVRRPPLTQHQIYFGNWMRDYSQAIDIGTVKSVSSEAIRLLLCVLGFMTFGYGSKEFEVTAERLGMAILSIPDGVRVHTNALFKAPTVPRSTLTTPRGMATALVTRASTTNASVGPLTRRESSRLTPRPA